MCLDACANPITFKLPAKRMENSTARHLQPNVCSPPSHHSHQSTDRPDRPTQPPGSCTADPRAQYLVRCVFAKDLPLPVHRAPRLVCRAEGGSVVCWLAHTTPGYILQSTSNALPSQRPHGTHSGKPCTPLPCSSAPSCQGVSAGCRRVRISGMQKRGRDAEQPESPTRT